MKRIWYYAVRIYVTCWLYLFYDRIVVKGISNIPRDSAILFAANHQNAFLDAIVIACTNKTYSHFLVRGDIFKKRWIISLLNSLNMMPVFRIRDGWQSLGKNQATFDRCEKIFSDNGAVVIFPEGNHGSDRRLRPLSKGFTRVVFESIRKKPDHKIYIVPVGLNYTSPQSFRGSVSAYYGEPLLANHYYHPEDPSGATRLKDHLAERMKSLITHVDDVGSYTSVMAKLELQNPNYLDPVETNRKIALIEEGDGVSGNASPKPTGLSPSRSLRILSRIFHFIPLALWTRIRKSIKDPVFVGSLKFVFMISVIPIYYLFLIVFLKYLIGS